MSAQKVPEVVALVRELHGQRQSLRQISKTLAAQGHLPGGRRRCVAGIRRACGVCRCGKFQPSLLRGIMNERGQPFSAASINSMLATG
jgi:hypothetical protein